MQMQCQTRGVSARSTARSQRPAPFTSATVKGLRRLPVWTSHVVRAAEVDEDAELEKRLANLRKAKGATPYGEGVKKDKRSRRSGDVEDKPMAAAPAPAKKGYDFSDEQMYMETSPSAGDVAFNIVLAPTLVWLPLTLAAVGRKAFLKYRFTNRRLTVISTAPWRNEQTDVAYQEVKEVQTVGRMLGLWGDLIVTLKDNSKVEIRMLDKYMDIKSYILERRDALAEPEDGSGSSSSGGSSRPRGKDLSAEELLNGPVEKKGFA